jgi:hypothetical protein
MMFYKTKIKINDWVVMVIALAIRGLQPFTLIVFQPLNFS